MPRHTEPVEVYKALVSALADNLLPTVAMGATLFSVGVYTSVESGHPLALGITIVGVAAAAAKALFTAYHRQSIAGRMPTLADVRKFETGHTLTTWCMAAPTGALCALLFALPSQSMHVVATALIFGYCAGIATRISVRPRIAAGAVLLAAGPALASAAVFIADARILTAAVFLVFLVSAFETIAHIHRNACRLITTRLQMAKLARLDPLTQLSNRLGLCEAFDDLPRDDDCPIAVHVFDLDGFKVVNDTFGHAVGDQLLCELAERLRQIVGPSEIIARIGGDEFVVVQTALDDPADPRALAQRIHDRLTEAYNLDAMQKISIGLSLGYSIAPAAEASLDELLRDADATAYTVKRDGGGFRPHRFAARQASPGAIAAAS